MRPYLMLAVVVVVSCLHNIIVAEESSFPTSKTEEFSEIKFSSTSLDSFFNSNETLSSRASSSQSATSNTIQTANSTSDVAPKRLLPSRTYAATPNTPTTTTRGVSSNNPAEKEGRSSSLSFENLEHGPTTETVLSGSQLQTRRNIYIRGQLLNQPDPLRSSQAERRTVIRDFRNSVETSDYQDGDLENNNSSSSSRSSETNFFNSSSRRRNVGPTRKRFHNFKLLHDSLQGENEGRHGGESQFYSLLYGVGILLASSLATLVICLLLGFCRQKIKARLDQRRRYDKSGEYERVDSVSSIVDSACSSQLEVYVDDVIEDVTII